MKRITYKKDVNDLGKDINGPMLNSTERVLSKDLKPKGKKVKTKQA